MVLTRRAIGVTTCNVSFSSSVGKWQTFVNGYSLSESFSFACRIDLVKNRLSPSGWYLHVLRKW